jgi:hypothetical protein
VLTKRRTDEHLLLRQTRRRAWGEVWSRHRRDVSRQKFDVSCAFQWGLFFHRHYGLSETGTRSPYNREPRAAQEKEELATRKETDEIRKRSRIVRKIEERRSFARWLSRYAPEGADDISKFCELNNITKELRAAAELADRCFWGSALKLEKLADPETGNVQIVLSLTIRGRPSDEVLDAYYIFGEKLLNVVSSEKRGFLAMSFDMG